MSLRAKLVLWYTGVFGVSGCLLVLALFSLIARRMQSELDRHLLDEYEECKGLTLQRLDTPDLLRKAMEEEVSPDRYLPLTYRLYDTQAQRDVVCVGRPEWRELLAKAAPISKVPAKPAYTLVRLGDGDRVFRVLTGALDSEDHQMGMYVRRLDKRVASLRGYLFLVLAAVVLTATIGGSVLASRSLKPIDEIAHELSRIESKNLAERLKVGGSGDEADRLREAINRMLGRLEAAFDRLQSFTADAAHELRTPLAALQCRLEVAINKPRTETEARDALNEALDQVAGLAVLVDNMLFLARMDAEQELKGANAADVEALLRDVAEPFAVLAEQKQVTLSVQAQPGLSVQGDAVLLRRIVGNLLDNAVRCTPPGGRIVARAAEADGGCLVTVADTGIGIAADALGHVFDRFYRADGSRSRAAGGAGLGLSIVQRAVQLHRGTVAIESTPGEGTTVRVWLPAPPSVSSVSPPGPDRAQTPSPPDPPRSEDST